MNSSEHWGTLSQIQEFTDCLTRCISLAQSISATCKDIATEAITALLDLLFTKTLLMVCCDRALIPTSQLCISTMLHRYTTIHPHEKLRIMAKSLIHFKPCIPQSLIQHVIWNTNLHGERTKGFPVKRNHQHRIPCFRCEAPLPSHLIRKNTWRQL